MEVRQFMNADNAEAENQGKEEGEGEEGEEFIEADFSSACHTKGEIEGFLHENPLLGFISTNGYLRALDQVVTDIALSFKFGEPIGPVFRHKNLLFLDWAPDAIVNKKKKTMRATMMLITKEAGSVVWGGMNHVSGSWNFCDAVTKGMVRNDAKNYFIA